ncbi:MAG: DCL family protein [Sulfuricurvum sp.]|uniref:DCL family protein n=1 Tax=Sulfuricurvum sp. TaxID=2025608 RepID=UPI0027331115|nr:DCL family protein [Sulfuricurvum sp.]MDP2850542.1 DCL family protein [Sulfuricurvum sp.]
MAGYSIKLPHKEFSTKTEARQFFKDMLACYNDGDVVSSDDDDNILFDLIQRHPEVEEKVGIGINCFYRDQSPDHPTSCFHIKRNDGSTTDFSIKTCINSANPTLLQDFYSACRAAVSPRLIEEKKLLFSQGEVPCAVTGELVTYDNSEYRHTQPRFRDIVNNFIIAEELEITNDMIVANADMQYITSFANQKLADKFNTFHLECANLGIVKKYVRR